MKYAYRDVLGSLTREKKKGDGTLTRFVFRPLSYPVSWLFLAAGWTPNAVTALGGVCCALAFLFALTPVYFLHVAAVVLFLVFAVLDCADGNMARTVGKKTVYGGWADAIGGYFAYATQIAALGFSCWYFPSSFLPASVRGALPWGDVTWLIVAGIASCSNILMRLFFQSKKNAEYAAGIVPKPGKEKRFSEEIGITGYLPVLYLAGLLAGFLPVVLVGYAAVYTGGFLFTTLRQTVHIVGAETHE